MQTCALNFPEANPEKTFAQEYFFSLGQVLCLKGAFVLSTARLRSFPVKMYQVFLISFQINTLKLRNCWPARYAVPLLWNFFAFMTYTPVLLFWQAKSAGGFFQIIRGGQWFAKNDAVVKSPET